MSTHTRSIYILRSKLFSLPALFLLSVFLHSTDSSAPALKYREAEQHPLGNAIVVEKDRVVPLYPIKKSDQGPRAIGYIDFGSQLSAIDETGHELWRREKPQGTIFGGFDFDQDGWVDAGINCSAATGLKCGSQDMLYTWIEIMRGRDGARFQPVSKEISKCWTFPSATYPTHQWSGSGILFGSSHHLVAVPFYATSGSFLKFKDGEFITDSVFYYPSTSAYDTAYKNDKPNIYGEDQSHIKDSHFANGLILSVEGENRVVFFTSARVVQYKIAPLDSAQLVLDTPFITGGRLDLAGRNYGLVLHDTSDPNLLVLISGSPVISLFNDMRNGTKADDPWGEIERHVCIYNLENGRTKDRFFSSAHDDNDGHKYENRIVYPNTACFSPEGERGSRLVFNVYRGGHWYIHITRIASVDDELTLRDRFIWDIRDLNGDGIEEWVISPALSPDDRDGPGPYLLKWQTILCHWQENIKALKEELTISGAVPYLLQTFRRPTLTSSKGYLYPVLNTFKDGKHHLLMLDTDKKFVQIALETVF